MNLKPLLRGRIHQVAFYFTIFLTIIYFIITSQIRKIQWGIIIYLLSQLLLFGISSTYHTVKWKTQKMRRLFQKLDHASIFMLISGTQTSVVLFLLPKAQFTYKMLLTTWAITLFGFLKVFLLNEISDMVDVIFYIFHGVSIVPFFKYIMQYLHIVDIALFISGGAIYIVGGLIYGIRRPDPFPQFFGYHEIFHLFTILANLCFMIPMAKKYFEYLLIK